MLIDVCRYEINLFAPIESEFEVKVDERLKAALNDLMSLVIFPMLTTLLQYTVGRINLKNQYLELKVILLEFSGKKDLEKLELLLGEKTLTQALLFHKKLEELILTNIANTSVKREFFDKEKVFCCQNFDFHCYRLLGDRLLDNAPGRDLGEFSTEEKVAKKKYKLLRYKDVIKGMNLVFMKTVLEEVVDGPGGGSGDIKIHRIDKQEFDIRNVTIERMREAMKLKDLLLKQYEKKNEKLRQELFNVDMDEDFFERVRAEFDSIGRWRIDGGKGKEKEGLDSGRKKMVKKKNLGKPVVDAVGLVKGFSEGLVDSDRDFISENPILDEFINMV